LLEKAKIIRNLQVQADFIYYDKDGRQIVEDVKGFSKRNLCLLFMI